MCACPRVLSMLIKVQDVEEVLLSSPVPPHVLQGGLECDVGPLQPSDAFNSGAAVRTTGPPANREGQHSKWGAGSCKFLWATLE